MELLYIRYAPKIRQFAMFMLRDAAEAEDVTQDVFLKLWEKRSELDSIESMDSYLFRMSRNSVLNVLKHRKAIDKFENVYSPPAPSNPENDQINRDMLTNLSGIFRTLPDSQQRIFKMNRVEGKTYDEIAEDMGISPRTVQYHISKVLKKFRQGN